MTIVLGTALVCAAAIIFAVLAVVCRSHNPPALLQKDLTQTLSLLALMALVAAGIGVFAEGFNQAHSTTHLIMAGLLAVGTVAGVFILTPWNRFAVATASAPTDFKNPVADRKPA
jgi:hypothetical membrane protein